ncbi:hypothetical protein ACLKA6_008969 [Drosophila palustris]
MSLTATTLPSPNPATSAQQKPIAVNVPLGAISPQIRAQLGKRGDFWPSTSSSFSPKPYGDSRIRQSLYTTAAGMRQRNIVTSTSYLNHIIRMLSG